MSLIQTIDSSELFRMAKRAGRGDKFGRKGWEVIGDFLKASSDQMESHIDIDIVGICCDYNKADNADAALDQLQINIDRGAWDNMSNCEKLDTVKDYLKNRTLLVCCKDNLIIWHVF